MKVYETGHSMPSMDNTRKAAGKGKAKGASRLSVAAGEASAFAQALTGQAESLLRADLDDLMEELMATGEALAQRQTFEEMEKFKLVVKTFVEKVVNQLYKLKLASPPDALRNRRVNMILEKVDIQLEHLARGVLAHNNQALDVLLRVDQIRGMLCDLYK
jgi:uncharacterized protein YaaR (DUF327 family)